MYPVIADVPTFDGRCQFNITAPFARVAVKAVGAPGAFGAAAAPELLANEDIDATRARSKVRIDLRLTFHRHTTTSVILLSY